jgi:dCMP deaminase
MKKKSNHISWDKYFMGVCFLSAMRSKDPNTRVGACIVNSENKIVGTGYNGFPIGCSDKKLPWNREGKRLKTKYPYVVHAEANAIINSTYDLKGCKLYVGLFPCNECTKLIIQSKISEIVYISDKYKDLDDFKASTKMLKMAGVKLRQLKLKNEKLVINMTI